MNRARYYRRAPRSLSDALARDALAEQLRTREKVPRLVVVAIGEMKMNDFRKHVSTRHGANLSPDEHEADHEVNFRILEHLHEKEIKDAD